MTGQSEETVRRVDIETVEVDLAVAGAGMAGIVCAIQAARLGLRVALINDRGYLGGNASPEIRTTPHGASGQQEFNFFAREGGIIEEMRLENLQKNPHGNCYRWEALLRDFVYREENIQLFLETNIDEVAVMDGKITWLAGTQQDSETRFCFKAALFADNTGDGTAAYLAGAEYRYGREGKDEFGEQIAPEQPDSGVLPSTMRYEASPRPYPVPFVKPDFAWDVKKMGIIDRRPISQNAFRKTRWWHELGGELDQIKDIRTIIDQQTAMSYGLWDYTKNSGEFVADNDDLDFVGCLPGKRESRRCVGDYILTERDLVEQREHEDAVACGGWSIDLHAVRGVFDPPPPTVHYMLPGVYQIPYRALYSKNINNLFLVGRDMSCSHVAHGSLRVMATLAACGQAAGAAAALCRQYNILPRGVYTDKERLRELQQVLLLHDQYIPGLVRTENLAASPVVQEVRASSVEQCRLPEEDGQESVEQGDGRENLLSLEAAAGFSLPVESTLESIAFLFKAETETEIEVDVYTPNRLYGYGPDKHLGQRRIKLQADSQVPQWYELELNLEAPTSSLFFVLRPNPRVSVGITADTLPGIVTLRRGPGKKNHIDPQTIRPQEHSWKRTDFQLCFRTTPAPSLYQPENVVNGVSRPCGLPNAWVSRPLTGSQPAWLELQFEDPETISETTLVFDADLDTHIRSMLKPGDLYGNKPPPLARQGMGGRFAGQPEDTDSPLTAMPSLVKDYTLYAETQDGHWQELIAVTDNFQRVNHHRFEPFKTSRLHLEIAATHGASRAHVYEVRVGG